MKNLVLALLILGLLTSCGKFNSSSSVTIKGEISGTLKKGTSMSDASKIYVIKVHVGTLLLSFVDIIDGSFTINSEEGIVTSLVFLDEDDQYIGTLSPQGLNLLPLCNLSDWINTVIDLKTLTLEGTSVIPSHDPLGNEIIITEDEINRLKEIDGFFESLAKNIDADNDGILDVLNDKQLYIANRFDISNAGHWGENNESPNPYDDALNSLTYMLHIQGCSGFSYPDSIVISGPPDQPSQEYGLICFDSDEDGGFMSVISKKGEDCFVPFESGTYTINIDDNPYTMDYSRIDAERSLVFVIPTLHTNDEGELVSISLEYKLADGTNIDPVNILTDVGLQFSDISHNQFYDTPRLVNSEIANCDYVIGLYSYKLDTPLDISTLDGISVGYSDLLGNTYAINWH